MQYDECDIRAMIEHCEQQWAKAKSEIRAGRHVKYNSIALEAIHERKVNLIKSLQQMA